MAVKGIQGEWNPRPRRCAGKVRFNTERQALIQAERLSRESGELLLAYLCWNCQKYHVGHADRSQRLTRDPALMAALSLLPTDKSERKQIPGCCAWCGTPTHPDKRTVAENGAEFYCGERCKVVAARFIRTQNKGRKFKFNDPPD